MVHINVCTYVMMLISTGKLSLKFHDVCQGCDKVKVQLLIWHMWVGYAYSSNAVNNQTSWNFSDNLPVTRLLQFQKQENKVVSMWWL